METTTLTLPSLPEGYSFIQIDNTYVIEGNKIMVINNEDQSQCWCNLTEESLNVPPSGNGQTTAENSKIDDEVSTGRVWSRNAILYLISKVRAYEAQFISTTIKNDKVWAKISTDMKDAGFLLMAAQCRDKWKYLKQRYMKKKDNMKDTASGAECIKFEFFAEIDELLGKKPNVEPLAIASSSKENIMPTTPSEDETTDTEERPRKKTKKNSSDSMLQEFMKRLEEREKTREQRHAEELAVRNRAIESFNEKMDAIIKKL